MKKDAKSFLKDLLKIEDSTPTINAIGEIEWKLPTGELHRKYGPAYISHDGLEQWYLYGKFHREDGPANIMPGVFKEWYLEGKLHRGDGPAVECLAGDSIIKEFWIHGRRIEEEEFLK